MSKAQDVAISVNSVSKNFKLPHQKTDSIKSLFINPFSTLGKKNNIEAQHALKDISFNINKGEFFGIVGRNGSGKSTLLKLLAGIYVPTNGSVDIKGRLVPFIELGVGFNPELTGRENVYLSSALNGFSEKETDDMYDDIVEFAELSQFMDQKLKNYSSGMQVRLAFSVATRAKADILLIDEVLAVGDADFQRKCFDYFKSLKKQKVTVVFVSHDMNAVREYCDRAALIDDSRLVKIGTSEEIATKYTRLFNRAENMNADHFDKDKRWGNRNIEHTSVSIDSKIDDSTEYVTLNIKAKVNITTVNPIFGYTVKSPSGQPVTGTNMVIIKNRIGTVKAGQELSLSWKIPAIFSNGIHQVDVAIADESGVTAIDWWEEAARFRCEKTQNTPYVTSPKVTLKFN